MSTVAGFAEDWPQSPFDRVESPKAPAQSPQAPVQSPQAPVESPQAPVQSSKAPTQSPQNWTQSSPDSQSWTQNLYAKVDVGAVFQQNATLYQSLGAPKSTATFNPGIRGDIVLGYDINESWAAEFDTGLLWNSMAKVGGASLSSLGQSFDTYTIPLLVNVTYKIPLKGSWSPYVGVGFGGAAAIASFNTGGLVPTVTSDSTFVFAYQAAVGLKYKLTKNASIDIAYEFFGATDPSWNFNKIPDRVKEGGFYTHSFSLDFTWNFLIQLESTRASAPGFLPAGVEFFTVPRLLILCFLHRPIPVKRWS